MVAQIGKILEFSAAGKVRTQVVPFSIRAYSVAHIGFTLLEFAEPVLPPVVFVEGLVGGHYRSAARWTVDSTVTAILRGQNGQFLSS